MPEVTYKQQQMGAPIPVICPHDRALLRHIEGAGYHCDNCQRQYPVQRGVARLLDRNDEFYEGAYQNQVAFLPKDERPWHVWPLWLINSGYPWMVRRHVAPGSTVVEIGCAGGVRYFGKRYRMIGCDLSRVSLERLETVYTALLQVDATACIALADQSVDAVVSSYFWEHIPPALKPRILSECARILRPGGKIIFLYDVETNNPLIRRYKRKAPELYQQLFLDGDGHLGYQAPDENADLFRAAGFSVLEHHGMEKTWLQSTAAYTKLAAFGRKDRRVFGWTKWLDKKPAFYPYTALMRLVDTVVDPLLPKNWARMDLLVCAKR